MLALIVGIYTTYKATKKEKVEEQYIKEKFTLEYKNGKVKARYGLGVYTKTDLGIVKYNFEIGAGVDSSIWAD